MDQSMEISRLVYLPGRKIYGVAIMVVVKPGVLHALSGITSKYNVTIVNIVFSKPQKELEEISAFVVLDLTKATVSIEKIIEEAKKLDIIKDIKIINPLADGLVVDTFFFPLTIFKKRACIFRQSILKGLFRDIRLKVGEAAKVFLYHQGFMAGGSAYKDYIKIVKDHEKILKLFAALVQATGWGRVEIIMADWIKRQFILRIYDLIECELCKPSNEPSGYFFKGAIAGLLTKITGKTMNVKETKCITIGDPYCQFEAE